MALIIRTAIWAPLWFSYETYGAKFVIRASISPSIIMNRLEHVLMSILMEITIILIATSIILTTLHPKP